MRVVGGRFRGKALATPKSGEIRPTSDRVREALFNILASRYPDRLENARVLDLFAGTGALGIEAMSRGARSCTFVDDSASARALIRRNIENLSLQGQTRILRRDATRLGQVGTIIPFDILFADPPYSKGLLEKALASALAGGWLNPAAIAVLEEHRAAGFVIPEGFRTDDERFYGDTAIRILHRT